MTTAPAPGYRIRRSYLVRVVQEYDFTPVEDCDLQAAIAGTLPDGHAFHDVDDELVGKDTLVQDWEEGIDDDELTLQIVSHPGAAIPAASSLADATTAHTEA